MRNKRNNEEANTKHFVSFERNHKINNPTIFVGDLNEGQLLTHVKTIIYFVITWRYSAFCVIAGSSSWPLDWKLAGVAFIRCITWVQITLLPSNQVYLRARTTPTDKGIYIIFNVLRKMFGKRSYSSWDRPHFDLRLAAIWDEIAIDWRMNIMHEWINRIQESEWESSSIRIIRIIISDHHRRSKEPLV